MQRQKSGRRRKLYWTPPPRGELIAELEAVHKSLLRGRISRTIFVYREFGLKREMLLLGGTPSLYALDELILTYIEGLYLSTIMCAHIFVEQTLGGHLILCGEDDAAEGGLNAAADKALELGFINTRTHNAINALRRIRIAYAHSHVGLGKRSHMNRIVEKRRDPSNLLKNDAKAAVIVVSNFLRHLDPNFGPPR